MADTLPKIRIAKDPDSGEWVRFGWPYDTEPNDEEVDGVFFDARKKGLVHQSFEPIEPTAPAPTPFSPEMAKPVTAPAAETGVAVPVQAPGVQPPQPIIPEPTPVPATPHTPVPVAQPIPAASQAALAPPPPGYLQEMKASVEPPRIQPTPDVVTVGGKPSVLATGARDVAAAFTTEPLRAVTNIVTNPGASAGAAVSQVPAVSYALSAVVMRPLAAAIDAYTVLQHTADIGSAGKAFIDSAIKGEGGGPLTLALNDTKAGAEEVGKLVRENVVGSESVNADVGTVIDAALLAGGAGDAIKAIPAIAQQWPKIMKGAKAMAQAAPNLFKVVKQAQLTPEEATIVKQILQGVPGRTVEELTPKMKAVYDAAVGSEGIARAQIMRTGRTGEMVYPWQKPSWEKPAAEKPFAPTTEPAPAGTPQLGGPPVPKQEEPGLLAPIRMVQQRQRPDPAPEHAPLVTKAEQDNDLQFSGTQERPGGLPPQLNLHDNLSHSELVIDVADTPEGIADKVDKKRSAWLDDLGDESAARPLEKLSAELAPQVAVTKQVVGDLLTPTVAIKQRFSEVSDPAKQQELESYTKDFLLGDYGVTTWGVLEKIAKELQAKGIRYTFIYGDGVNWKGQAVEFKDDREAADNAIKQIYGEFFAVPAADFNIVVARQAAGDEFRALAVGLNQTETEQVMRSLNANMRAKAKELGLDKTPYASGEKAGLPTGTFNGLNWGVAQAVPGKPGVSERRANAMLVLAKARFFKKIDAKSRNIQYIKGEGKEAPNVDSQLEQGARPSGERGVRGATGVPGELGGQGGGGTGVVYPEGGLRPELGVRPGGGKEGPQGPAGPAVPATPSPAPTPGPGRPGAGGQVPGAEEPSGAAPAGKATSAELSERLRTKSRAEQLKWLKAENERLLAEESENLSADEMAGFDVVPIGMDEKTLTRNADRLRAEVNTEVGLGENEQDVYDRIASGLNNNEGQNGIERFGNWLQRWYDDPNKPPNSWVGDDVRNLVENKASTTDKKARTKMPPKAKGGGGAVREVGETYEPGEVQETAIQLNLFDPPPPAKELQRSEGQAAHGDPDWYEKGHNDVDESLRSARVLDSMRGRPGSVRGGGGQTRKQWAIHKRIDFTGKVVRTFQQIAELFSAYSHPSIEHFHLIYTKGDVIAGHNAMSAGMPNMTLAYETGNSARAAYKVQQRMKRLGADGVYILHNHPSAAPDPSSADQYVVMEYFKRLGDKLKGAIIIDDTEFTHTVPSALTLSNLPGNKNKFVRLATTTEHFKGKPRRKVIAGRPANLHDIASLAAKTMKGDNRTVVMVVDNNINTVAVVPVQSIANADQIKQFVRENGGMGAIIATDDLAEYGRAAEIVMGARNTPKGVTIDVVRISRYGKESRALTSIQAVGGLSPRMSELGDVKAREAKAHEGKAKFVYEPEAAYPAKLERTLVPQSPPLSGLLDPNKREEIRTRLAAWKRDRKEWAEKQPLPATFLSSDNNRVSLVTPNTQEVKRPFRVTHFFKSGKDWIPSGHEAYESRTDALLEAAAHGGQYDVEGKMVFEPGTQYQAADLFAGTEFAADEKAQARALEQSEIKARMAQRKGGRADLENLPMFRGLEIEGTAQTDLFAREQSAEYTKGNESESLQEVMRRYDDGDLTEGDVFKELVNIDDNIEDLPAKLKSAVERYKTELAEDREYGGRGELVNAGEELIAELEKVSGRGTVREPDAEYPARPAAGSLPYGAKLPKYTAGNINLERMINKGLDMASAGDEAYDLKKLALDVADRFPEQIKEAKGGKQTFSDIEEGSRLTGIDPERLATRLTGEGWNAKQIHAARVIVQQSGQRLRQIQKEVAGKGLGNTTDNDMLRVRMAMNEYGIQLAQLAGVRAEAARALSAQRMIVGMQNDKDFESLFTQLGGREINDDLVKKFLEIDPDNAEQIAAYTRAVNKATFFDMFYEYWINSILSGPPTQVANLIGNAVTSLYVPLFEKPITAALSAASGRNLGTTYFGEAPAELLGMWNALPDAVRTAWKVFWGGEVPGSTKLEMKMRQAIPGPLGSVIRTPGRALVAADQLFKTIVTRQSLYASAYRQALSEKTPADKIFKRTADYVLNPTEAMMKKAKKEAEYRTFTNPLGKFGSKIMGLRSDPQFGWIGKFLAPFIQTPTNIAKFTLERTPAGLVTKIFKKTGKAITDDQLAEELAKPIVGSVIMATFGILAARGLVTGGGPKDKKQRDALWASGWRPYSLRIGDTYVPFNRIEPVGSIIGLAADFATMGNEVDWKDPVSIVERVAYAIGKGITSKTMLQGATQAIDAVHDPKRYGQDWIQNMAGSMVPAGGLVGTVARAQDEDIKEARSIMDAWMAKTPGLTVRVPDRIDAFGRPLSRDGNFWSRLISPTQFSAVKGDPVADEIVKVNAEIGPPNKSVIPGDGEKSIQIDPWVYEAYAKFSGREVRKRLEELLVSDDYKAMDVEQKKKSIEDVNSDAREPYRKAAKQLTIEFEEAKRRPTVEEYERLAEETRSKIEIDRAIQQAKSPKDWQDKRDFLEWWNQALPGQKSEVAEKVGPKIASKMRSYVEDLAQQPKAFIKRAIDLKRSVVKGEIDLVDYDRKIEALKKSENEYERYLQSKSN